MQKKFSFYFENVLQGFCEEAIMKRTEDVIIQTLDSKGPKYFQSCTYYYCAKEHPIADECVFLKQ